jgi:hypothetical protein
VNPVDDAPVANDDTYAIDEDTVLQVDASGGVLANDYDSDGDSLTVQLMSGPLYGVLTFNPDGSFAYTSDENWFGIDSFVYEVSDGTYSDTATVYLTVNSVNDAPVAVDDYVVTDEDTSVIIDFMANDYDIEGDSFDWSWIAHNDLDLHGQITLQEMEVSPDTFRTVILYTPNPDWYGSTSTLHYTIRDALDAYSTTAWIHITVNPVNDAPVANDDAYIVDEDTVLQIDASAGVLANDADVDGDILQAELVSGPVSGVLTLNPDGSFTYMPDLNFWGTDSFTYVVTDGFLASNVAIVAITIDSVNDAPVAADDSYFSEACVPLIVAAPGVLENDFDVDGDLLQSLLVDMPLHGAVALNSDGSFTYTPDAAWCGVDTFTYYAFDGLDHSNIAAVTITVVDVTPPVTTIQFVGLEGEYGWYHSDVEVILSATDDSSGVASTMYSLDGLAWMLYTDPFALTDPGEVTVHYYSTDNAGNVEETKTSTIKIGKPTRSFVTGGGWIWDSGGKGHFAFVVKYKCNRYLTGSLIYTFGDDGYKYMVISIDWLGMAIDGNHALIEGKCIIRQYSCETREKVWLTDLYFRIEVWDNGKCERDIFQIRIFDESGELFHEAGFDPLGEVHHGSIRIHERGPRCICWCWFKEKWV